MGRVGWLKLYRPLQEHALWKEKPFAEGQAWVDILMRVSFVDDAVRDYKKKNVIRVSPGEAIVSIGGLSLGWGWSKNRVIRFLKMLKNDNMIEYTSGYSHTKLKVLNWKKYQDYDARNETDSNTHSNTQARRTRDGGETQADTDSEIIRRSKEGKNGKEGKELKKGAPRPSDAAPQDRKAAIASLTEYAKRCNIKSAGKQQYLDEFDRLLAAGFSTRDVEKVLEANKGGDIIRIVFGTEPPIMNESVAERRLSEPEWLLYLPKLMNGDPLARKNTIRGVYIKDAGGNWRRDEALSKQQLEDKVAYWNSIPADVQREHIRLEGPGAVPPGCKPPEELK